MDWIRNYKDRYLQTATLDVLFPAEEGIDGLKQSLDRLFQQALQAIDRGASILILSDRSVTPKQAPIPMLLAVSGLHHYLIRQGKRMRASLVVESGEPRDVHHFAVLIGYGAAAIYPYLVYETIQHLVSQPGRFKVNLAAALSNYKKSLEAGILKIMSKMGISTVSSYRGAQIFEALGLGSNLVDQFFTGTPSRIGGIGLDQVASDDLTFHGKAFGLPVPPELDEDGFFRFRKNGEYHAFNPTVFKALHKLVETGDQKDYRAYAKAVQNRQPTALRDLLSFRPGNPVPLDEVESVEAIVRRFATSGMSHGALSREAHETIAIAMNRIGAKSNSGEGGEDRERYHPKPNGDWPNSKVKQVASARFGVTPEYLNSAAELEIKMAQGSKPGEGGQLPGGKVSKEIAAIRHSVPGVTLISPPPHHDIYSIEDLAQLIHDLKEANRRAKVCVKLVAEVGVGTIAAGVAKAYADVIHIAGHDGGTGASPLTSIKHAGIPWELGLAETQQVLMLNGLRERVTLRTDGGLKTGRDVVIAAMLGADEFGFGSAAVVATGCVMARQCHLNTCPVGVATQNEQLRAKFTGKPEYVVNLFMLIAGEVREILAALGFRKLEEIIGRTDLLVQSIPHSHPKAGYLDLSAILVAGDISQDTPRKRLRERNDRPRLGEEDLFLNNGASHGLFLDGGLRLKAEIANTDRTVGAKLSGEIARVHGDQGLPDGSIEATFEGSAGQSFGAFCIRGMRLILFGEANDYVGKGMAGGELVIRPPTRSQFASHENVIIGNTVLYGATGGTLYAAGRGGERFCVRNSGARAVIEGLGDHGCEYMTGGIVVVLGEVGKNFAAGMTGGVAYVLDEAHLLPERYNPQLVSIERLKEDNEDLLSLLREHLHWTESPRAQEVLTNWEEFRPEFWVVMPHPPEAAVKVAPSLFSTIGAPAENAP
jgi:glutamate synthase domain-containing protein 2/glutamate synthase domain-containing protein 3